MIFCSLVSKAPLIQAYGINIRHIQAMIDAVAKRIIYQLDLRISPTLLLIRRCPKIST